MRHKPIIFINKVHLPKKSLFLAQIKLLIASINDLTGRKNKPSEETEKKRSLAATLIIQGLYRCFCSQSHAMSLGVPHRPGAYKSDDENLISTVGFKITMSVVDAMQELGWIHRKLGYRTSDDGGEMTEIRAAGELLEEFQRLGVVWEEMKPLSDVIVLRNYDDQTKKKYKQKPPDSDLVRNARANLNKLNKFFKRQCICLDINVRSYERLGGEMLYGTKANMYQYKKESQYPKYLDFTMVQLRRIFSRDSMKLGGRFYGGWWQFIPKKYRVFITINWLPTVEIDYSGLHPYMLYHLEGLEPPEGDMYDIGLWSTDAEKDVKRPIIKEFFNAIINDENGRYVLPKDHKKTLGISSSKLLKLIKEKHAPIAHRFESGYGLTLQYEDSQIAEQVLVDLFSQGIVCLPIHDSFIVQSLERAALERAMTKAYKRRFGSAIDMKATFQFDVNSDGKRKYEVQHPLPVTADERVDHPALFAMFADSIHAKYVQSHRLATGRP